MRETAETAVTQWFGEQFSELHPQLQALHRQGGTLKGAVEIRTGTGIAGWLGHRLAGSLGIPVDQPSRSFWVSIQHQGNSLDWIRHFDNGAVMASRFEPVGTWPDGYWIERAGPLSLHLTVDIVKHGWEWRCVGVRYKRVPVPLWLLPKSPAGKHIENGKYVFRVEFSLPLIGTVLSYGGALDAVQKE